MDWQPIETAPKDGTRILVVAAVGEKDERAYRAMVASWREQYVNRFAWVDAMGKARQPTHWLPIPALPTTGASS